MTQTNNPVATEATEPKVPKYYEIAIVKKLEKSEVEITGSIPAKVWESFRTKAIKNLNEVVNIDGFRKGNIPENILISKIGEKAVLEEMAELALTQAYIEIVKDKKIDAIGKPDVGITKLAKGNPLEFKATTSVMPEITLPEYKKLAAKEIEKAKKIKIEVTEKDTENALVRIRKMHASHEGHDHDKMTQEEHDKAINENLPEVNDEFVKKIGDFKDVADFKAKLAVMLHEEKTRSQHEKTRISMADAIADATKIDVPQVMIESELDRTEAQFKSDVERMNVKMDDYLKHAKKTIEEVRKEWLPHAEKKAKLQLILNEIARLENIKPDPAAIEEQVKDILEHYKDADRESAYIYSETVLTNDKVFEFLEKQTAK